MENVKRSWLCVLVLLAFACGQVMGAVYWDNSDGDNDFTNDSNWGGDAGPTTYPAVNMTGGDQATLLTGQTESRPTKLWIGNNAGTAGEMTVDGGDLTLDQFLYVGYYGTGSFTLEGGSITTTKYDVSIGDKAGGDGTLVMNGGTITAKRFMTVGNAGKGKFEMNGGVINVNQYDLQIADDGGSEGHMEMYDGEINIVRDLTVGGAGVGTLDMYGGVITCGGKITIPELTGGDGTLNLYDGTINGKLWMRNVEFYDPSNKQLVNIHAGQFVMADADGTIASSIQVYIDNGWIIGYDGTQMPVVQWNGVDTTRVFVPEPVSMLLLGMGGLAVLRRRR